jgi:hypothetical protein
MYKPSDTAIHGAAQRPTLGKTRGGMGNASRIGGVVPGSQGALMKKADFYLFITIGIAGTWAFGVFAIPFAILTYHYLNKAQKAGELTRPWSVTIVGAFVLIDASVNFFGWGTDFLWSNQTALMQTLWPGYGKLVDGAYYIDYNSSPLFGLFPEAVGGLAHPSEKTLEAYGVLCMYPLRIAACWGLLKMKRWGLTGLIISSWMYIGFWMAYVPNMYYDFAARNAASDWGVLGTWFIILPYASPFLIMPYLYSINRELFSDSK